MQKNINLTIREKFDKVYTEAKEAAEIKLQQLMAELCLDSLSLEDKILKVHYKMEEVEKVYDEFDRSEYTENYNSEDWLFNFYYNKLLMLNRDEADVLREAIILSTQYHELIALYWELGKETGQYSFDEYMKGKEDVFLSKLDKRPFNIEKSEYYKIRNWQCWNFIDIVEKEFAIMKEVFRREYNSSGDELIVRERANFNSIYKHTDGISELEIINRLKKFVVLKDYDSSLLKDSALKQEFLGFANENAMHLHVTPASVKGVLAKYKKGTPKVPVSGVPFILYALNRYDIWIEEIEKGKLTVADELQGDFIPLFESTINDARKKATEELEIFFDTNNTDNLSAKELEGELFEEFESLRHKMNKLEHLNYYSFIGDEEALKCMFCYNCYFGTDIERQVKQLFDSVYLDEKISSIGGELYEIFGNLTYKRPEEKGDDSHFEIYSIINQIVFDSSLYKKFRSITDRFFKEHEGSLKPFYFLKRDYEDDLEELYHDAIDNLRKALSRQEQTKNILYLQERLKEIRHRELSGKIHGWRFGKFLTGFKEFLQIEAEYIKETKDLKFIPVSKSVKALPAPANNKFSFGYIGSDVRPLETIYSELSRNYNFINDDKTTLKQFIEVFTAKDLSQVQHEIHAGCDTTLFAYIIDKMKPMFKNGFFTAIENYGLFKSDNGNIIRATAISKSKAACKSIHMRDIDKFFKQLQ